MPKTHPRMKLSRKELTFLRHWMFDETHFQDGPGAAKQLQVAHGATPADLAILIAAALPEPAEQEVAGMRRAPGATPQWPWSKQSLRTRVAEAQAFLGQRRVAPPGKVGVSDS
jgi:hypothetical protein